MPQDHVDAQNLLQGHKQPVCDHCSAGCASAPVVELSAQLCTASRKCERDHAHTSSTAYSPALHSPSKVSLARFLLLLGSGRALARSGSTATCEEAGDARGERPATDLLEQLHCAEHAGTLQGCLSSAYHTLRLTFRACLRMRAKTGTQIVCKKSTQGCCALSSAAILCTPAGLHC